MTSIAVPSLGRSNFGTSYDHEGGVKAETPHFECLRSMPGDGVV